MEHPQEYKDKLIKTFGKTLSPEDNIKTSARTELTQQVINIMDLGIENLWKTTISTTLPPQKETFPCGTEITFVPLKNSSEENWRAVITMSLGDKDPKLGALMFISGKKTPEGYKITEGNCVGTELSDQQIDFAIAALGIFFINNIENT
jgi:hypothetical protein